MNDHEIDLAELEILLDLPIPIDQHLEIERAGATAFKANLRLRDCPYPMGMMIRCDDPRVPAVSAVSLWARGWQNAYDDKAIARRTPTKGMWKRG